MDTLQLMDRIGGSPRTRIPAWPPAGWRGGGALGLALVLGLLAGCPRGPLPAPSDGGPDRAMTLDRGPDAWWGCVEPPAGDAAPATCPPQMVLVLLDPASGAAGCVDRYEASRGPQGEAVSHPGAQPWTSVTLPQAVAACEAAGKRLCRFGELALACAGAQPEGPTYPYGGAFDPGRCNWAQTGLGKPWLTGSSAGCQGRTCGLFDLAGNVREWTLDLAGSWKDAVVYGGSYAGSAETQICTAREKLTFGGSPTKDEFSAPTIGFRCCLVPTPPGG